MQSIDIIHRDLKPSNILLTKNAKVKICDFGSAVEIKDKDETGNFQNEGFTTWYKAPELIFGKRNYLFEIDIWSFGCIFAEFHLGVPLFHGQNDFIQLNQISTIVGTPNEKNWPDIKNTPNYKKIDFIENRGGNLLDIFKYLSNEELEVIKLTICYGERVSAFHLLNVIYFKNIIDEKHFNDNTIFYNNERKSRSYQSILQIE